MPFKHIMNKAAKGSPLAVSASGDKADRGFPSSPYMHDLPEQEIIIRPSRTLNLENGRFVLGLVALGLAVPVIPLLGTLHAWALLPFVILPVLGLYWSFKKNMDDGKLTEHLRYWPNLMTIEHKTARGEIKRWQTNPYWMQVKLEKEAKLENYLTLKSNAPEGDKRIIELGRCLSPKEREELYHILLELKNAARISPDLKG